MTLSVTRGLLCAAAVFAPLAALMAGDAKAVLMAEDSKTLFPSSEFRASVFAESANGQVDIESHQDTIHATVTPTPTPFQLARPSPSGSPVVTSIKHRTPSNRGPGLHTFVVAAGGQAASGKKVTNSHDPTHYVKRRRTEHHAAGGGIQLAYFINRFVGIAADAAFLGGNPYVTAVTANVILRYPFEFGQQNLAGYGKDGKSDGKDVMPGPTWGLAPYVIFGGGGQWDGQGVGIADVGGGLEFRFRQHYGLYLENRWIVRNSHQNYDATTIGVSYNF